MEKFRCFLAINIPEFDILPEYDALNAYKVKKRLVNPKLFHLTIHFFGEISYEEIDLINNELLDLKFEPITYSLEGGGRIPSKGKKSRVLFVDIVEGREQIIKLVGEVRGNIERLGFKIDKRKFLPHLTICRIRGGFEVDRMVAEWENIGKKRFLTAKFDRIHLVKSTLTSSDPIYEILNSYPSKIE